MLGKKTLKGVLSTFTKLQTEIQEFNTQNDAEIAKLEEDLKTRTEEKARVDKIQKNLSNLLAE